MPDTILFIYKNDKNYLVLNANDAKESAKDIEESGFVHVATIDAESWIMSLINSKDPIEKLKELKLKL